MRYTQMTSSTSYPYPDHNINPKLKDAKWCMAYAKAAYHDWSFAYPKGVFANNQGDYEKFSMYALGKQPITPYKKQLGIDEQTNHTWLSVDWTVRPIISKYRDMAISRLMKQDWAVVATPIDMMAKAELSEYYNEIKAKLAVRELIKQTNQEFANHPLIALQPGEPLDVEELQMRVELGEQFNRSKDAEMAIELGFYENDYKYFRRKLYEYLFDYGVAGYKEWLGEDNKAKFRAVNPENVVTNYCRKSNFSDLIHAGEIIDVPLIDLALVTDKEGNKQFTNEQLQEFASSVAGKWGNPTILSGGSGWIKPYDKFKCKVLDLEFYSYDEHVYRDAVDQSGNPDFRKADFNRGKQSDKYIRKTFKTVYKVKWIVGTDYCYDWGIAENQKRPNNPKRKGDVSLSYRFFAYNFYEMKAQGMMERLVPYLDEYQLTILKIQNFKNRAVPSGWWIDFDALENVAMNKGGSNMTPRELLQMFFETGVLAGRSVDEAGNPRSPNWKPVIPIENTAASELAMFYQDLLHTITQIESMTGYNAITAGDPNPKTLVPGYETANMSTNDALYPLAYAETYLTERLAEDVLLRMQQGIKRGGISGYAPALSTNVLRFIEISPAIALREYGIMLQEKTTDEQKMWVLQQMQGDIANGFLDTSDAILILNTHNAKQASQILAYKVGKAKQAMNQQKLAEIQANNEGAAQAAQAAEQAKLQGKQMEWEFELKKQEMAYQAEIAKEQMRIQAELEKERMKLAVQNTTNVRDNQTKLDVAEIQHDAKVVATAVQGEQAKEKQEIANQKKSETKK